MHIIASRSLTHRPNSKFGIQVSCTFWVDLSFLSQSRLLGYTYVYGLAGLLFYTSVYTSLRSYSATRSSLSSHILCAGIYVHQLYMYMPYTSQMQPFNGTLPTNYNTTGRQHPFTWHIHSYIYIPYPWRATRCYNTCT